MFLPVFQWMESSALGTTVRESAWLYAIDQVVHLLFLVVFAGAVLVVDLHLLGRGLREQPRAQVARAAHPWVAWSLFGLLLTGIPQMFSTAIKEYYSSFFWEKMTVLLVAVIFTFTIRRWVTLADEARVGRFWPKIVGLVSIALWGFVAAGGRLIGLLS
jgi:hypothetical protein